MHAIVKLFRFLFKGMKLFFGAKYGIWNFLNEEYDRTDKEVQRQF